MKSTALVTDSKQRFSLESVTIREPGPNQVQVKTHYSGVSIGTEFALIRNKISWGPYPLCTGYMATGIVQKAGSAVKTLKPGDRVYYYGNRCEMALESGTKVSCVCGGHSSHAVVTEDPQLIAPLPPGAAMETACFFVMPAVGLLGSDMANPRMGEKVVVYGTGLIGLGVTAACAHRGCVVIAVDKNPKALAMAKEMGADYLIDGGKQDVAAEVKKLAPDGADVVFECTGLSACIDPAIALCRFRGKFVWQGNYGAAPVSLHFLPAHAQQLTMVFPCGEGGPLCQRAVVKNMAMGALKWEKTVTHRIASAEAPALFERINKGDASIIGAVVKWE
ncbi:MAG: zinc-binding alcohol dehydrogenase [Kiritimatiellae bacterium]|nr:zinc-binding alcohol dehydrogenase [Kiritimatiellia bacterium]